MIEQAKAFGLPKPEKELTEEEKEKAKKIANPDGSRKISFENFKKLMFVGIEKQKLQVNFTKFIILYLTH